MKWILVSTLLIIWVFQYFFSYMPGFYMAVVVLLSPIIWLILTFIAFFHLRKYWKTNDRKQFGIALLIFFVNAVVLLKPGGFVNWEKLEEDNVLVAAHEGTAGCTTILKLKQNNQYKMVSVCFGKDFYFGRYELRNDTVFLFPEANAPFIKGNTYALLKKTNNSKMGYNQCRLYETMQSKRGVDMMILEVNLSEITPGSK